MLAILSLIACGPDLSGVWAITVPYDPGTIECNTAIDENYDGHVPDGGGGTSDGDWTYTDDFTGADALTFFQIMASGDGKQTLFMGGLAYPGVWNQDQWEFSWSKTTAETAVAKNDNDYGFAEVDNDDDTTTITLKLTTGETGEGSVESSSDHKKYYEETDEWDNGDVGTNDSGNTPVDQYLIKKDSDDNTVSQRNISDDDDCDGSTCKLTVQTTCSGSGDFTAERVRTDDQDAYEYVMSHGQSGGGSGGGGGIDTGGGGGDDTGF